jgi:hypothetical protein
MNPSDDGLGATKSHLSERIRDAGSRARDLSQQAYGAIKAEPPWVIAVIGGLFAAVVGMVAALFLQRRRHMRDLTV